MKDKSTDRHKKPSYSRVRWLISIFLMALTISAAFSFLSQGLLNAASLFGAFVVLLAIIAIGIFFDLLGVAVTAAEEKPFHSMASRKVPGAVIAVEAAASMQSLSLRVIQLLLSALVAALTILGKAFCKQIALDNSTNIVHGAAKVIWRFKRIFTRKKSKKK